MESSPTLKQRVRETMTPIASDSELSDHLNHTDDSIASQRDYLKRVLLTRSDNPVEEADAIQVVNTLNEDTICPFINGHMAKDS